MTERVTTDTPKIGVNLAAVDDSPTHRLGAEVFATNGKRYVYAKAGGAITASTAVCAINATTFVAAATGGSYASPATNMASGQYGWFAAASV